MDSLDDIENVGQSLIKDLQNKEITEEVKQVEVVDPFLQLKEDTYSFFRQTMKRISAKEGLLAKIDDKIFEFIEMNELDFDQLMTLRRIYSSDSLQSRESVLGLFKPVPGVQNLLIDNISKKDEANDSFNKTYDNLSPEQIEKMAKLIDVIRSMENKGGEEK